MNLKVLRLSIKAVCWSGGVFIGVPWSYTHEMAVLTPIMRYHEVRELPRTNTSTQHPELTDVVNVTLLDDQ